MAERSYSAQEFDPAQITLGTSFLLVGTDAYLIDQVSDQVRKILRQEFGAELIILYGEELSAAELNDHLDCFSIFSSAKLILIKNGEGLSNAGKKKELQALADYFAEPSDNQSIMILADKIDLRVSAWKKIKESSIHITCDQPKFGGAIRPWLEKQLKEHGKSMDTKAIEAFCSRIELDYSNANNELTKLLLLNPDKKTIKEEDVLRSIGSSRVGTQIDFFRSMGTRNLKTSMELMERMLQSEWEPLQIFFQIGRFFNIIWRLLLLRKHHITPAEIVKNHLADIYPSQRQEYVNFSNNYTLAAMEKAYAILIDTDSKIKLSAAQPEILLQMCLLEILTAK